LGAGLALSVHGRVVVDLWGGWADPERTEAMRPDHLVPVLSTSKMMLNLCLLKLVDEGKLALDSPICTWWPEFAQGDKAGVTLMDLFTHQAGIPAYDPPVPMALELDWQATAERIAAQEHWFGGERRVAYHGFTYGLIGGELIRRVDGRMPGRFFREAFAEPAGIDFHLGTADRPSRRAGFIPPGPPSGPPPEGLLLRMHSGYVFTPGVFPPMTLNPAGNGWANGRSIARGCAILAGGGSLDGTRYLSEAIVHEVWQERAWGECPYLGWLKMGLGFGLSSPYFVQPSPNAYGWGGTGGSFGVLDTTLGYALGYAPNNFALDRLTDPRVDRLYRAMATVAKAL
jgi:CubicO group peptidase (beta-lactamase class C family)